MPASPMRHPTGIEPLRLTTTNFADFVMETDSPSEPEQCSYKNWPSAAANSLTVLFSWLVKSR